ncbi:ribosomal RNA small subunit methyltransferase, chloroplastic isoform X1 [Aristolochia californica]|uniref:ribosomal RNA small subunit methyltransferase, chloroplastic isoform X1 n=1 Tax=Aristolochia californica TaxID=171875 RepID=UPI0035DA49F1
MLFLAQFRPSSLSSTTLALPKPSVLEPDGSCPSQFRVSCARSEDDYHATLKALNSRGRTPRKSLGQHYMLDSSINEQLVGVAEVREGDVVLEIGPGTGSLTNVLLSAGASVVAIEKWVQWRVSKISMKILQQLLLQVSFHLPLLKDPHMAMHVKDRFNDIGRLLVLQEDVRKCHIRAHLNFVLETRKSIFNDSRNAKVVSNLPFNISTDVVKQLLPMGDIFSDVVLLLQDEAASRLVDAPLGTPEYRPINIFVNFYSVPQYKFKVPRANFFPQPNVDGAVVKFKLKQSMDYPPVASPKSFFSMVNSAFNGKRKMLRKSLQHICTPHEIESALQNLGLPITSRPAELTLDDFVRLHNSIPQV